MRFLKRTAGVLAAGALVTGMLADAAAARITSDGIAGVKIGMTEDAVRATLGQPSSVRGENGAQVLDYRRRKIEVTLAQGEVIRVITTSRAQTTSSGVGPGVSQATMQRKLRGERCGTALGARVCWVLKGDTVLGFSCRGGRVKSAEVARAES